MYISACPIYTYAQYTRIYHSCIQISLIYTDITHVYICMPRYHSCIYPYALFTHMHNTLGCITHAYIYHPCICPYAEISLMYISVCPIHTYEQYTRIYHSRIHTPPMYISVCRDITHVHIRMPYSHVCKTHSDISLTYISVCPSTWSVALFTHMP